MNFSRHRSGPRASRALASAFRWTPVLTLALTSAMSAAQTPTPERLKVGDATTSLLALQRSGDVASATSRAIPGEIATRSYQRYLKSFEHPIPERLGSTTTGSAGNAASPGGTGVGQ